ncbi:autotransporter outer membrane beta-barrel domain-containing protein [Yersinia mollaretii]|uniref:autotransporter outer membrane beta-barrel domain-containing protein n=1 Tax=Yersinia mollaretii TaxID=33060 RepID=UPI00067BD561|nr:autotransporter outer membrane beta-barrel domain-containing protein [Yersinia mollaretii]
MVSPLYCWAAQTISVTNGSSVPISGDYGTDDDYQPAVVVKGMGSTVTGGRVFSKTYWQSGAGINVKVNSNVDIYADVKYQRAFDGKMEGYAGNLGVKVSF